MTQATSTSCAKAGCDDPALAACGRCGRVYCGEHVLIRQGTRGMVNLCDDCRSNAFSRYLIYVVVTLVLVGIPGGLGYLGLGQPGAICGGFLGAIVAIFVAWRIMPE